jgi:hypothetical protein
MKTLAIALLSILAMPLAHSQDAQDAAAPAKPERYQARSVSAFNYDQPRAPFTPIGWVRGAAPAAEAPVVIQAKFDESLFRVSSILLGNPAIAVVNGRSYEEGQLVRMPKGSSLRPRVFRIMDGQVILQADERLVTVPLRRGELNERRPEDELLNEEKEKE